MAESNKSIRVKKVSPYPFDANIEIDAKKVPIEIRRLTLQGLIAGVGMQLLKVGTEYKLSFMLPVLKDWVFAHVKVMKTYDQFKDNTAKTGNIERMVEFRILAISNEHKDNISKFLTAINQS
jgi:hypothetical protein